MPMTTVTSKGQIVIPAKIRSRYGINKGTKVSIEERKNEIILKPLTAAYLDRVAGVLKTGGKLSRKLLKERSKEKEKKK